MESSASATANTSIVKSTPTAIGAGAPSSDPRLILARVCGPHVDNPGNMADYDVEGFCDVSSQDRPSARQGVRQVNTPSTNATGSRRRMAA